MSGFNRDGFNRRAILASATGGVLWTGLLGRLVQLQLVHGQDYAALANENRIRLDPAPARRGIIYDRFGQKIATNKRNFYVMVVPEETENFDATLNQLASLVPITDRINFVSAAAFSCHRMLPQSSYVPLFGLLLPRPHPYPPLYF